MKKFSILTIAPALALLAAGCSSPTAMQSTEYDDMYYSTADKTEYIQPADEAYAQVTEAQAEEADVTEEGIRNPEYSDRSSSVTDNYYGDDEYDYYDGRAYDPRDNWYRPSYSFVDPFWAADVYGSSYHNYPRSYRTRYYADAYYDPFFYDPFYYDPFAYRPVWGSGVSISISYHYGWGNYYSRWNPYYYGRYYNPWYPHYNNYYYNNYYGGYYGRQYVYDYPRSSSFRKVQYGPRGERGGLVTGTTQQRGERGSLTESSEQRIERARPNRTTERVSRPATTQDTKEVITTRPGRENYRPREEARPTRERIDRSQQQRQQEPATREVEPRTRTREYRPRREYRQEQRSTETRRIEPRRETTRSYEQREVRRSEPTRSYEQPREVRRSEPAPSRSSGSSGSSSGSSRGGRPPRGN